MTLGNFTKKIKQIKWYYQGTAAKVLYVSFPWQACLEMRLNSKVISPHYDLFFALDNDFMDVYISQDSLRKTALYYYNQQRLDSSFFISFNRSWQDNFSNPYLKVANKIIKEDLYRYSDKELQLLINDFFNKYLALWQEIIFLDGFDFYGHKIIQEIISDLKIKNSDLNILLLSFSPSSLQKERLSLLNLAEKVIKNRQNKNLILNSNWEKIKRLFPLLARQLNHHANQYYWLHNDYASVTTLDSRYFLSGLKEIIKNPKLFKKEKELKLFLSKLLSQKRKLIKKYKLN
ncbi:MAG: hypothetical protein MUF50_03030, partial [Planctomycetes bacterium]|nr:hypothetical protein [Planctomycetota bacterium]